MKIQMLFAALIASLLAISVASAQQVPVAKAKAKAAPTAKAKAPAKQPATKQVVPSTAAITAKADWVKLEAMWSVGGSGYQAAVNKLASKYYAEMGADCQIRLHAFDVTEAVKAYQGFVRHGMEKERDSSIRRQVATLACSGRYDNGADRVASLQM